jgi:Cof subfamily protein (haloacid dehalogenase superfamily)
MIRLAVSDMDGCLLDPQGHLSDEFHSLLNLMEQRGCIFAAASGRSRPGVSLPFGKDISRIALITDNGSQVLYQGRRLALQVPDQKLYLPVLAEAARHPNLIPVLCGCDHAYLSSRARLDERAVTELHKYFPGWELIDDLTVFPEPIIKVALLYFDDIEKNIYPYFAHFNGPLRIQPTAYIWADVYSPEVSKGTGVGALQQALGIAREETAVFGDYLNDIAMADYAAHSYAPANAHPEVKAAFTDVIPSNRDNGVIRTLQQLMAAA